MVVYAPKCSSNAPLSWFEPAATDNSGHVIINYPAVRPPANLSIGLYSVQYSATDEEGNRANCSFIVQVASMLFSLPQNNIVLSFTFYHLEEINVKECNEHRNTPGREANDTFLL